MVAPLTLLYLDQGYGHVSWTDTKAVLAGGQLLKAVAVAILLGQQRIIEQAEHLNVVVGDAAGKLVVRLKYGSTDSRSSLACASPISSGESTIRSVICFFFLLFSAPE